MTENYIIETLIFKLLNLSSDNLNLSFCFQEEYFVHVQ